jgi:hypothetical protein
VHITALSSTSTRTSLINGKQKRRTFVRLSDKGPLAAA